MQTETWGFRNGEGSGGDWLRAAAWLRTSQAGDQCNLPLASLATRIEVAGRKARAVMAASATNSSWLDPASSVAGSHSLI
jgi:hypothetical protein